MSDFFEMKAAIVAQKKKKRKVIAVKAISVVCAIAIGGCAGIYSSIEEAEKPVGEVSSNWCKINPCQSFEIVH